MSEERKSSDVPLDDLSQQSTTTHVQYRTVAQAEEPPVPSTCRNFSACFINPISTLLFRLRRQPNETDQRASYDSEVIRYRSKSWRSSEGIRRSLHGISTAFSSLRGRDQSEPNIYVFKFVSPTLFLYGKDLKQEAEKKLDEWRKIDGCSLREDGKTAAHPQRHFIVDCSAFIFIDNAGASSMVQVYNDLDQHNVRVYYAAARESIRTFFVERSEAERVPQSAFYPTVDCAMQVAQSLSTSQSARERSTTGA